MQMHNNASERWSSEVRCVTMRRGYWLWSSLTWTVISCLPCMTPCIGTTKRAARLKVSARRVEAPGRSVSMTEPGRSGMTLPRRVTPSSGVSRPTTIALARVALAQVVDEAAQVLRRRDVGLGQVAGGDDHLDRLTGERARHVERDRLDVLLAGVRAQRDVEVGARARLELVGVERRRRRSRRRRPCSRRRRRCRSGRGWRARTG